jgi:hypothetical protein
MRPYPRTRMRVPFEWHDLMKKSSAQQWIEGKIIAEKQNKIDLIVFLYSFLIWFKARERDVNLDKILCNLSSSLGISNAVNCLISYSFRFRFSGFICSFVKPSTNPRHFTRRNVSQHSLISISDKPKILPQTMELITIGCILIVIILLWSS